MSWRYRAFGLDIEADQPIPGLSRAELDGTPDLVIDTSGAAPDDLPPERTELYTSPHTGLNELPLLRVSRLGDRFLEFLYDDGASFLIDVNGSKVWAQWPSTLTMDDVGPYLTGPIVGIVLRLRGRTSLHASAVVIDGRAVAFVGPAGAGKSTTAAALARRGFAVLTEDIVTLTETSEGFAVFSGYPWIRLWPETVEALFGSRDALPRIAPADPVWNKRFLDLEERGFRFAEETLPLGAIYILAGRSSEEEAPRIDPSPAREKLLRLVAETYSNYVPGRRAEARGFELLARVIRRVPVRLAVQHADVARLEQLCDLILEDYAACGSAETAASTAISSADDPDAA